MSDPVHRPEHNPLLNDSTLTYLGVLGSVLLVLGIFFAASLAGRSKPEEGVDAALAARRVALRAQVEGEGLALISSYGKNASGTYRIPAAEAEKILVENTAAALDAVRAPAAPAK